MKTEGTNLLLLTISAFWSSRSIALGGRYWQVSLYYEMYGSYWVSYIQVCSQWNKFVESGYKLDIS